MGTIECLLVIAGFSALGGVGWAIFSLSLLSCAEPECVSPIESFFSAKFGVVSIIFFGIGYIGLSVVAVATDSWPEPLRSTPLRRALFPIGAVLASLAFFVTACWVTHGFFVDFGDFEEVADGSTSDAAFSAVVVRVLARQHEIMVLCVIGLTPIAVLVVMGGIVASVSCLSKLSMPKSCGFWFLVEYLRNGLPKEPEEDNDSATSEGPDLEHRH